MDHGVTLIIRPQNGNSVMCLNVPNNVSTVYSPGENRTPVEISHYGPLSNKETLSSKTRATKEDEIF